MFNGKGKFVFPDHDKQKRESYQGGFKDDKFHGIGKIMLNNGESYRAKWDNGLLFGQGVYTFSNGVQVRFTYERGKMVYENRLIFPEDDFRL